MAASYEAWEAVTDEEQLEVPNGSHSAPFNQKMKTEGNNYPWRHDHERMMAEFWLNNPIFYDKSQEYYKNKDRKIQLIQELIQQNREEWEKIRTPLPTVNQVTRHLRNIRTRFGKLLKRKSVDPTFKFSHRDQFILDHYQFLRPHLQRSRTPAMHATRAHHVRRGSNTLAQAAQADFADMEDEDASLEETPSTSGSSTWTTTPKKHRRDNPTLLPSGPLLKQFEPSPLSRRATFANFVRDSLLTMSKPKYKLAKAAIWDILHKLDMDDDSACSDDFDDPAGPSPLFITPSASGPVAHGTAPPTCWEISSLPHMNNHL
ncbi:uncharacterized protein LOC144880596 [Branchiostoma floridae x Branchiostoma japonicum]